MTERARPSALLVAAVVVAGTLAGGLVAAALFDDDDGAGSPSDSEVVAAIRVRADIDADVAGCVLGRLVVDGVLTEMLRRRLVDATDDLADVPSFDAAVDGCATGSATSSTATTAVDTGPLAACTAGAGEDPAAREVCATQALVTILVDGAGLDSPTASCAAAAVVDELGVDAVVASLETAEVTPDLRERLQAAFAACT